MTKTVRFEMRVDPDILSRIDAWRTHERRASCVAATLAMTSAVQILRCEAVCDWILPAAERLKARIEDSEDRLQLAFARITFPPNIDPNYQFVEFAAAVGTAEQAAEVNQMALDILSAGRAKLTRSITAEPVFDPETRDTYYRARARFTVFNAAEGGFSEADAKNLADTEGLGWMAVVYGSDLI